MLLRAVQLIVVVERRPVVSGYFAIVEGEFVWEVVAVRDHGVRLHILILGCLVGLVRKHVRRGARADGILLLVGIELRLVDLHLLDSRLGPWRLQVGSLRLLMPLALTVVLGRRPEGSDRDVDVVVVDVLVGALLGSAVLLLRQVLGHLSLRFVLEGRLVGLLDVDVLD